MNHILAPLASLDRAALTCPAALCTPRSAAHFGSDDIVKTQQPGRAGQGRAGGAAGPPSWSLGVITSETHREFVK
jgi:hypothetical protein